MSQLIREPVRAAPYEFDFEIKFGSQQLSLQNLALKIVKATQTFKMQFRQNFIITKTSIIRCSVQPFISKLVLLKILLT